MNNQSIEAKLLLDNLNTMVNKVSLLPKGEKKEMLDQIQKILTYFEAHKNTMPIGRSVSLGYYFEEDLSYKG